MTQVKKAATDACTIKRVGIRQPRDRSDQCRGLPIQAVTSHARGISRCV